MSGSFGQQNFLFPSVNMSSTFQNRLCRCFRCYGKVTYEPCISRADPLNMGPVSGTGSHGFGEVEGTGHGGYRADGATSGSQSDVDAELSKLCTIFESDSAPAECVARTPPLTHSTGSLTQTHPVARPPSTPTPSQMYNPPPYPPSGSVQSAYPLNWNLAPSWTPPPTSVLGMLSQSPYALFQSGHHPSNAFQHATMDADAHHTAHQADYSCRAGPVWPEVRHPANATLEPYASYDQAQATSLPALSHSQATTPTYSPSFPHTPLDGPDCESTASGQFQPRSPFLSVVVNDPNTEDAPLDKPSDATPVPALSLGYTTHVDFSNALPAPAVSLEHETHYARAVDSSHTIMMPASPLEHETRLGYAVDSPDNIAVDHSERALAFQMAFRFPHHPSTSGPTGSSKCKRTETSTSSNFQETKSAAVPFETRRTRRHSKEFTVASPESGPTSSIPLLSSTLHDRGRCKFSVTDENGVTRRCGHELVKDAKSVRAHFAVHYEQLGYYTRRDDMIKAALERGVSADEAKLEDFKVRCPWCDEEPTLFGGLNRHIVDKELKINSVRCGCGGRNSRGNQKHNGKRHEDSETHKAWMRKLTRESEAVAAAAAESAREEVVGVLYDGAGEEAMGNDGDGAGDYIEDSEEGSSKGTKRRRF